MKRLLLFYFCQFLLLAVVAQNPLTSGYFNYHLIDRYEILSGQMDDKIFTSVKPYARINTMISTNKFEKKGLLQSSSDQFNKDYLYIDNAEYSIPSIPIEYPEGTAYLHLNPAERKPILKTFYARKNAFYHLNHYNEDQNERLLLTINPVLGFALATDNSDSLSQYRNSRGVVIRGTVGGKVGFFTRVIENQFRFPSQMRTEIEQTNVVPGGTLHKPFGKEGEDFFTARGYITFSPINEIMVQFGHDNLFIGNGYRSLILSNQTAPFPFLRFNTRVWKLNYQNIFMEHVDYNGQSMGQSLQRKFSAMHHLSVNVTKNLNIGIFENIIFDRQDSTENNRYELGYLNPIIFYRAVEHGLNSTDNAMLGLDWKWNFLKRFSFYGQWVFDEFVKNEFIGFTDDWVNKWAYQAGIKYINVAGVNNLDLQLEVNQVRPFVYSHRFKAQNWAHYNQELAHPLGANFREFIGIVRFQPKPRWNIQWFNTMYRQGVDSSFNTNRNGANIFYSNNDIISKDNAPMFQGLQNRVMLSNLSVSYMFFHNFFVDASIQYRTSDHDLYGSRDQFGFGLGLRLNTARFMADH